MTRIAYRKGYKYQLGKEYLISLPAQVQMTIDLRAWPRFLRYYREGGYLLVKVGYAWDGPSGPTIDTKTAMRASLEHDVYYQLMRLKILPESFREAADEIYRQRCKEDGMGAFRRWYHFKGLRWGAARAADPKNKKKIIWAP